MRKLTEAEHKEILAQLDSVRNGHKVLFVVTATPTKPDPYIEKNFEVSLLTLSFYKVLKKWLL